MKKLKHTINLSFDKKTSLRPNSPLIKKQISFLLDILCDYSSEVSMRFCGFDEMVEANGRFRNKQKSTDVLSFLPDFSVQQQAHYLGDILICVPVCENQAKLAKHTLSCELTKMVTHSLVHLKGFDHDRSKSAARVMEKLEKALLLELSKHFENQSLTKV